VVLITKRFRQNSFSENYSTGITGGAKLSFKNIKFFHITKLVIFNIYTERYFGGEEAEILLSMKEDVA